MTNYIKNKSINCNKVNDILDLNGVDEIAWNLISAIYKSEQDSLITNKNNRIFRQQVISKFTPKIQETRSITKGNKSTDKLVSFKKLPSPIPMKTFKKVKKISKFFKKSTKLTEKNTRKSYA